MESQSWKGPIRSNPTVLPLPLLPQASKLYLVAPHPDTSWTPTGTSSIPTPCSSKSEKKTSVEVLNFSRGDSTTSLGSLFQCCITLTVKKFFLVFIWNFPCSNFCLFPLVLSLDTTKKSPPHQLYSYPLDIYKCGLDPLSVFFRLNTSRSLNLPS